MFCKKMGRNVCLVVIFLSSVMIFYAITLFHIHSSVMGKSSADMLKERLKKQEIQRAKEAK
ncbi:MAG TPA: hypothetical protein ENK87_03455 [Nitratifractor sp.]|jgi:uncharacterized membrane protein|nr:hypothetical protein [Nitratifractor sp.]HHD74949.1 hypothetical protein [Nitratifractor sp.]HHH20963.1 hypothetical protein [Nitratifractor sp.]